MERPAMPRLVFGASLILSAIFFGSAMHLPAVAAQAYRQYVVQPDSCSSSLPCLTEKNAATGPGVQSISLKGYGAIGQTFAQQNGGLAAAGIFGIDSSNAERNGPNSGVLGVSTIGIGVLAKSRFGTAMVAKSASGLAVDASSAGTLAMEVVNNGKGDGIEVVSMDGYGVRAATVHGSAPGISKAAISGADGSSDGGNLNQGVIGTSITGTGVRGFSSNYVGVNAIGGGLTPLGNFPALSVVDAGSMGGGNDLIDACSSTSDNPCFREATSRVLQLDTTGNLVISGHIFTSGSCSAGCIRHGGRQRVLSYAPTQTVPSIDDFGEAQLVDGQAYVRLGADFANVIDGNSAYLVFITPEGDCNVLYAAHRTHAGFEVRESHGGRSSVGFSYRVVAKPYGERGARLPVEFARPRFMPPPHSLSHRGQ